MNQDILKNLYLMLIKQGFTGKLTLLKTDQYSISGIENINQFLNSLQEKDYFKILEEEEGKIERTKEEKITFLKKKYFPCNLIERACVLGYGEHKDKGKLIILFSGVGSDKIGKQNFITLINQICALDSDLKNIVFVHAKDITSPAKDVLDSYKTMFSFQLWPLQQLRKPFLSHYLMPTTIYTLNSQEKKKFLEEKSISSTEFLPKLCFSDPMAKYLYTNTQDTVFYGRPSIYGYSFNLRCVVEDSKKKDQNKKQKKKWPKKKGENISPFFLFFSLFNGFFEQFFIFFFWESKKLRSWNFFGCLQKKNKKK